MPIAYKLSKSKSLEERTFHDFLVISSYFLGVNIVLVGIAASIQLVHLVVGTIVMWIFLIPVMIYTVRVLKYFWGLGAWSVLWRLFVGSFVGGIAGTAFLFACSLVFDIQIRQL